MITRFAQLPLLLVILSLGFSLETRANLESYCNNSLSSLYSGMAEDMIAAMNRARILGKEAITHQLGPTSTVSYGSRMIYEVRDSEIVFPVKVKIKYCQLNSIFERDLIAHNEGWIFSDDVERYMFSPMPINGLGGPKGPAPARLLAIRRAVCEVFAQREILTEIFNKLPINRQWWEVDLVDQTSNALRALGSLTPLELIQARAFSNLVKKLDASGRKILMDEVEAGKDLDGVLESVSRNREPSQAALENVAKEVLRMTADNIFAGFRLCQNRADIEAVGKDLLKRVNYLR